GARATTALRGSDGSWALNGAKRASGRASTAEVAVSWAATEDGIRGFLVPTDTPGFTPTAIEAKLSMRASIQCDITLDDVALPAEAALPEDTGLMVPYTCLNEARYGKMWCAMGQARDSFEVALDYAQIRLQVDNPLTAYQITQEKLVNMALEIQKGTLLALQTGRLKDAGRLDPVQISVGKLNNCREAIAI